MTELDPFLQMSPDERKRRNDVRRAELEPLIGQLVAKAKGVYETLRPHARHIAGADPETPLLHQQVYGLGASGTPEGVVADYLMIGFGNHHTLNLYRNFTNVPPINWRFTRSQEIEPLLSEQTQVVELISPRSTYLASVLELEVIRYRYRERYGKNPMYDGDVSGYMNIFENAEDHIAAFDADLDDALIWYA